jgi:hypothetical protein
VSEVTDGRSDAEIMGGEERSETVTPEGIDDCSELVDCLPGAVATSVGDKNSESILSVGELRTGANESKADEFGAAPAVPMGVR